MMKRKLAFLLLNFTSTLLGLEYVYPVGTTADSVFYVYQKSLSDLELWRYSWQNPDCMLLKLLYWRFIPANFTLLPDQQSFSFIDCGRLQIKQFIKRSPSAIDFDLPIFGINEVNWLDTTNCYFSAKQNQQFVVFKSNIDSGKLIKLASEPNIDCLCPKIINNTLFFVARHHCDRSCAIVSLANSDHDKQFSNKKISIDCGYQQIIYLQMLSPALGFYIEHMPYIDENSIFVTLICHKIESHNNCWQNTKLFKFYVPKKYLLGEQRLYESIIPFLPRANKTMLYFTDVELSPTQQLRSFIFSYDLTSNKTTKIITSSLGQVFFAPLICGDKLFYGQVLPAANQETDFCLAKILSLKIATDRQTDSN